MASSGDWINRPGNGATDTPSDDYGRDTRGERPNRPLLGDSEGPNWGQMNIVPSVANQPTDIAKV